MRWDANRQPWPAGNAKPSSCRTERSARAVAIALVLSACSASGPVSGPYGSARLGGDDAIVEIECSVADAELWVDERFVAEIGHLRAGIALGPGPHRIEVRHDRYHTHYTEITVKARERRKLSIEMAEILP